MKSILSFFTENTSRTLFIATLWTVVILIACFIPGNDVPKVKIFQVDKLVHIALFAGCSFLWAAGFYHSGKKTVGVWVFLACIALGVLVELVQSSAWVHGRSGDGWDVVADSIGALSGLGLYRLLRPIADHIRK